MLNSLLKDKTKLVTGMTNFIYEKAPDTKVACDKYGFSMETLFTMLSRVLEEENGNGANRKSQMPQAN